jgi:outer membrane protein
MKALKIGIVASLVFLFVGSAVYAEQERKIGYVDLSRLFDEYHKTKEYDKVLETKHKKYEEESKTKIEKIREQQGKLALLQEDKKSSLEGEVEAMKAELMEFDRQKKTDLTKERNEKIREILLEIEKIVSNFAEQNNYSVILNDRVLIYGHPSYDLTEEILKSLNVVEKPKP